MLDAIRFTPHILLVGSGEVGLSEEHDSHCYLIDAASCWFLVDSGAGIDTQELEKNIDKVVGSGKPLSHLLLTHCHADHAGGAAALQRNYGLQVLAGELCAQRIISRQDAPLSLDVARAEGIYPSDYHFDAPEKVLSLTDGVTLFIGDVRMQVFITPGHSADSTCFLVHLPEGSALFCGDTIFTSGLLPLLNTFDSQLSEYRITVKKLLDLTFDMILPGHGLFVLKNARGLVEQLDSRLSHSIYIPPLITP
ncbi:MAG: MBL fold metallo-hydrolase [Chloroflexi bacterium]|nr:MBL fold metallo-hydrolase [Chloroflexota bacterium]